MSDETAGPERMTLAKDTSTGRVGRVMGKVGPYIHLRPIRGGTEWEALPEDVESITTGDALAAKVREERGVYDGSVDGGWNSGACL